MKGARSSNFSLGWLVVGLDCLLLLLFGAAGWYSSREATSLRQLYETRNDTRRQSALARELSGLIADTATARATITGAIITTADLSGFIDRLEAAAASVGVDFNLASASSGDKANPNIRLDFTARGNFAAVWQFANLLDNWPVAFKFSRAEFSQTDKSSEKAAPTWQGRFTIELINNNDK